MEVQTQTMPQPTLGGNRFTRRLLAQAQSPLTRGRVRTLQINLGMLCNQTCRHCHVDAGPKRTEVMEGETVRALIALANHPHIETVDLTGGAPEMNPHFRELVQACRAAGRQVISRCNLTILTEPGYEWLADFYRDEAVRLVCSLPCYTAANVDAQRGDDVFARSITGLRMLNERGYGQGDPARRLDLVFNPAGPTLPGNQAALESDYKQALARDFGVTFDGLLTLANLPIGRFGRQLARSGALEGYLELLDASFNPGTLPHLMCRETLSVGWDGRVYDCDFNQMLGMELRGGGHSDARTVRDAAFGLDALAGAAIRVGEHCLGCTAGQGSSCGGALA